MTDLLFLPLFLFFFFFNDTATTEIYTLSLHDALPICSRPRHSALPGRACCAPPRPDRKITRLNSSHMSISYAVFCLKKKKKVQVSLYFLVLLAEQHRQQVPRPEAPPEPRAQFRFQRRPGVINLLAMLGEQLRPHLHVALFDARELDVDLFSVRIGFLSGEREVEVGGVGFILPVMQPFLHFWIRHAPRYLPVLQVTSGSLLS